MKEQLMPVVKSLVRLVLVRGVLGALGLIPETVFWRKNFKGDRVNFRTKKVNLSCR